MPLDSLPFSQVQVTVWTICRLQN